MLERELKKSGIRKSVFSLQIGEYPGIITDITKKRRGINAALSLKLDKALNAEEGYFMILQAWYEIEEAKKKNNLNHPRPDMKKFRRALFWDINPENLDFQTRKRFVIERVFERGNDTEIRETINFYGLNECREIIRSSKSLLFSALNNAEKYLKIKKKELECQKHLIKRQYPNL